MTSHAINNGRWSRTLGIRSIWDVPRLHTTAKPRLRRNIQRAVAIATLKRAQMGSRECPLLLRPINSVSPCGSMSKWAASNNYFSVKLCRDATQLDALQFIPRRRRRGDGHRDSDAEFNALGSTGVWRVNLRTKGSPRRPCQAKSEVKK